MNSNVPLDNAFFQLSPRRSRCELFVSVDGKTEKLASGFLKPFVTHLKIAEEQSSHAVHVINLEVGKRKNAATWFNKGTVERFVRFVSTPEVLELLSTLDAEMSQLEGARKMYALVAGHQFSGERETKSAAAVDATKKELVRAIDVRISAVKQNLATNYARASAAGFNLESVSDLLCFADKFGAFRLSEACKNFHSLSQRRPELISHDHSLPSPDIHPQWKNFKDANVRSSSGSDMSIDEPPVEQTGSARLETTYCGDAQRHHFRTCPQQQQSVGKSTTASIEQLKPDSHHFAEKDTEKVEGVEGDHISIAVTSIMPSPKAGGISRRLSVQDRINIFENKQKEQSGSPNVVGGNSGSIVSRLAGAKGEHCMKPSDLSVEKLVLRRWSGASDMSIDPNSNSSSSTSTIDRKESGSAAGTPISSSNTQLSRNSENEGSGLIEVSNYLGSNPQNSSVSKFLSTFSSSQDQDRSFPQGEIQAMDAVNKEDFASTFKELPKLTKEMMQANPRMFMGPNFPNSRESAISSDPGAFQTSYRPTSEDLVNDQMASQIPSRALLALKMSSEEKDQASLLAQIDIFTCKMEDGAKSKGASDSQIHFKASMEKLEGMSANVGSMHHETNGHDLYEQEAKQKSLAVPRLKSKGFSAKARPGFVSLGYRFPGKSFGTDYRKKFQGRRDGILPTEGSIAPPFQSRKINEVIEAPPLSLEESQASRPDTGNELNDVLHLKGEKLEKIFSEHKLNHSDQIASSQWKTSSIHAAKTLEKRPVHSPKKKLEKSLLWQGSKDGLEFDFDFSGMVESFDFSGIKMQKIGIHNSSDVPRGKLYGKYMQKRDAKLSQESCSMRVQKEAKMKEMHDRLELSQIEMKARFTGFSDGQKLADAGLREDKMRSFKLHSTLNVKAKLSESLIGDEDDVGQELCEPSIGNQAKKILSNKPFPTTSLTSVSLKDFVKSANFDSLRNRGQTENTVVQSVSSFSNLKNESIKPSVVVTKATTRGLPRNSTQIKSSIEGIEISKEGWSCWSNSLRKCSDTPAKFKDSSFLNSKNLHKVQIGGELRQYLKKGNCINHGSGTVSGKSSNSAIPEELKNYEKSEEIVNQKEYLPNIAINDENLESAYVDGNNLDLRTESDYETPRHSQESCELKSENIDLMWPLSQRDDSTTIFSQLGTVRNAKDSPEESSNSLNSHAYHSRAYRREASDIYSSLDSPTVSPSWNSHSPSHIMDSEAARMRKKWENAPIPVITASASQQSCRDLTKGFKRLLKFGRKSRGSDYLLNDWISASTASEGDDDPEDRRDLIHKPSDDFSKSRMGYNITYDGFNDNGIFPEQAQSLHNSIPNTSNLRLRDDHLSGSSIKAPRSFFSLSSFRSKAGESKPSFV